VAAQEACLLHELLLRQAEETDPLAVLAPAFFAEAASLIETPWALAVVPDLAHPRKEGDVQRICGRGSSLVRDWTSLPPMTPLSTSCYLRYCTSSSRRPFFATPISWNE